MTESGKEIQDLESGVHYFWRQFATFRGRVAADPKCPVRRSVRQAYSLTAIGVRIAMPAAGPTRLRPHSRESRVLQAASQQNSRPSRCHVLVRRQANEATKCTPAGCETLGGG